MSTCIVSLFEIQKENRKKGPSTTKQQKPKAHPHTVRHVQYQQHFVVYEEERKTEKKQKGHSHMIDEELINQYCAIVVRYLTLECYLTFIHS